MVEPKVAIIISTYNQKKLLEESLSSIRNKTNYKNYKVYVVDDSGKGEIGKDIKKKFRYVEVILNKKNKGFSGANNIGIKKALKEYNPDYYLLLNDDTEMTDKNWLKKMIDVGENDKKIGILGCKILYPDRSLQNLGGYLNKWKIELELSEKKKETFEVDHVMGAFLIVKREVVNEVGILDEIYTPYLLEDTDYCLRAKEKGWKVVSVPYVTIIHKKGKSIDSLEDKTRLLVRFKNDIIFSRKHLKGFNKFFRIFIYLPLVAIFKKKKDTDDLELSNFRLRKKPLRNLGLWFKYSFKRNIIN
jgi:GT2 family glycosyltransferase